MSGSGSGGGVAFVGCGASGGQTQARGRRREVTVGGRRVKTVDVHAHCGLPAAMALLGLEFTIEALLMSKPEDRLRAMDEQGIDVEALSINPFWYRAPRDVAEKLKPRGIPRRVVYDLVEELRDET